MFLPRHLFVEKQFGSLTQRFRIACLPSLPRRREREGSMLIRALWLFAAAARRRRRTYRTTSKAPHWIPTRVRVA